MKLLLTLMLLTTAMLLSVSDARADALNLSLVSPMSGVPGNILSFTGTITAPNSNSGVVYLNGDSLSLGGPFTLDDAPFILNAPFFMNPGETYTGVLFTVTINPNAATGIYNGFFIILGGSSPTALSQVSNAAAFQAVVVPEPATMVLLSTGLAGAMLGRRRRTKS